MTLSEIKIGDRVGFRFWGGSDGPIKEGIVVAIKPADVNPPAGHPNHNPATVKIKLDEGQYFLTSRIADLILLPQPAPQTSLVSNDPPNGQ